MTHPAPMMQPAPILAPGPTTAQLGLACSADSLVVRLSVDGRLAGRLPGAYAGTAGAGRVGVALSVDRAF